MAICPLWLVDKYINPKDRVALWLMGQILESGPYAERNLGWTGCLGDPQLAPIGTIPTISALVPPVDGTTFQTRINDYGVVAFRALLQNYLDQRRVMYEEAADNGSYRGSVLLYREEHLWRSMVWDILRQWWRDLYGLSASFASDVYGYLYDDDAENWRRKRMNNELKRVNERTLWERQIESRTMIGNLLGTAIMFTAGPADSEPPQP